MEEIRDKQFPDNYPGDAIRILEAMSFPNTPVYLLGSMSIRSQQYAGDYDAYQRVKRNNASDADAVKGLVADFQAIVKRLQSMPVYIGDIKSGVVDDWRVLPKDAYIEGKRVVGFNRLDSLKRLDALAEAKVITPAEKKDATKLVEGIKTPVDFLLAKKELKYHVVRWTPHDIRNGFTTLRDGRRFTLGEAFASPILTKMDVIGLVQNNRYTDFSMIYEFYNKRTFLNKFKEDVYRSLQDDILLYRHLGNPFKVLKRQFALAKYTNKLGVVKRLTPILNSDLGRLYVILGDIGTLIAVLESKGKHDMNIVRYEIDQFKSRMANIYTLKDFLKGEHTILGELNAVLKMKSTKSIVAKLTAIHERLSGYLNKHTPVIKSSGGA